MVDGLQPGIVSQTNHFFLKLFFFFLARVFLTATETKPGHLLSLETPCEVRACPFLPLATDPTCLSSAPSWLQLKSNDLCRQTVMGEPEWTQVTKKPQGCQEPD